MTFHQTISRHFQDALIPMALPVLAMIYTRTLPPSTCILYSMRTFEKIVFGLQRWATATTEKFQYIINPQHCLVMTSPRSGCPLSYLRIIRLQTNGHRAVNRSKEHYICPWYRKDYAFLPATQRQMPR